MQSERRHHENRIYKSGRLLFADYLLFGGNQTDWFLGNAPERFLESDPGSKLIENIEVVPDRGSMLL